MNSIEVISLLKKNGWVLKDQKGSHQQYVHSKIKGKITVPFHGKRELSPKTLHAILKKAGLT